MTSETNKYLKIERLNRSVFFRNTRRVLNNPVTFLGDLTKDYGPVLSMNIAGKKYVILQDPEFIKHVLSDYHKSYSKFGITKILRLFFGEGLVTSNGELWIKKRRLIQPAFHKQRLSHILQIINEETNSFIQTLNAIPSGSQINMSNEMLRLNISIVNRAHFSNANKEEMESMMLVLEELTDYSTKWMRSIIKIPISWPTPTNTKFHKNCEKYDRLIYAMIDRRRVYKKDSALPPHNDLLDMLLDYADEDSNDKMTNKQLRDEITTMFMAGHDTTAQTLSWIFYELAKNKDISKNLHREVAEALNKESIKLEDISKLYYTNKVIKEGMRRYPSISAIQRRPYKDDVFKVIKFNASTHLLINIYGMHHHPNYWKNPEIFNPERFAPEAELERPPFVYLPFGGGPRRCIGSSFATMVMQVVVSRLLKNFEFDVPKGYKPVIVPNITIKPKDGIPLIVRKVKLLE
jgi:cytochrome P450